MKKNIKMAKIYFYDEVLKDYRLVPFYHFVGILGHYKDNYFEIFAPTIEKLITKEFDKIYKKPRKRKNIKKQ